MDRTNLNCYFCGSSGQPREIEAYRDGGVEYVLRECSECGAQYWTPFKNPGAKWYEEDERYKNANNDSAGEPAWGHKKIISFLAPFRGRVFDIGCGTGNFLSWARRNGWDVAGIDFDSNAIHSAKTNFLLPNIELATLGDYVARHRNEKFDLVTFFDVFEHIDNHIEFLEQVAHLLKPGGYIAMSMPYRRGSRWLQPNDLPPRHLSRWDEKSLKNFLEKNGFSAKYVKRIPAPLFYIVMKLRFKYGNMFSLGLVNKVRQSFDVGIKSGTSKKQTAPTLKIKIIHNLAKIKDAAIFGIPALVIWLVLLFTPKRYTGLFVIARRKV